MTETDAGRAAVVGAVRRAGPLAVAGLVANGAGVLLTVGIARLLTEREYGGWTQLGGLFLVLSMPGSALLVATVRRVVAWRATGDGDLVPAWAAHWHRRGLLLVLGVAVVAVLVRGVVADFLSLPGPDGVAEVLIAGAVWALLSLDRGLLQAGGEYPRLAVNLVVEAAVKCVATVALAAVFDLEGVAAGLLLGVIAADVHARRPVGRWRRRSAAEDLVSQPLVAEPASAAAERMLVEPTGAGRSTTGALAGDLVAALAALALLALLQTLDVIILGRDAPQRSGDYAAISVASKALVFIAIVLAGYLLPEAAAHWQRGEQALRQLAAAVAIFAVPCVVLLIAAVGAPRTLLELVFGTDKADAAPAFAYLALAMTVLGVNVLVTNYLLGVGRRAVVAVLAVGVVATALLLDAAHGRYVATARTDLVCQVVLLAATGIMLWRLPRPAPRSS